MELNKFLQVAKLVAKCPQCKNDKVGEDQGSISCDEHIVTRTCNCGFMFVYDTRIGTDRQTVRRSIQKALKSFRYGDNGEKVRFTGEVGAKQASYMVDGELHTAWYTMLTTTEGDKVAIYDAGSPVGNMEAPTRHAAIKKGRSFLERMEDRLEKSEHV